MKIEIPKHYAIIEQETDAEGTVEMEYYQFYDNKSDAIKDAEGRDIFVFTGKNIGQWKMQTKPVKIKKRRVKK